MIKKCGMITKKACNQGDSSSFNQCEPQENLRLIPFRLGLSPFLRLNTKRTELNAVVNHGFFNKK